jgi:hypothetical protein
MELSINEKEFLLKYSGTGFWYLALPYSDPDTQVMTSRYIKGLEVVARFINHGFPVYCAVVHWRNVAVEHNLPHGYEFWKKMDRLFISKSDGIVVLQLPGWRESIGVTDEIEIAKSLKLPIMYISE